MERIPGQHPQKERMRFCLYKIEDNSSSERAGDITFVLKESEVLFSL